MSEDDASDCSKEISKFAAGESTAGNLLHPNQAPSISTQAGEKAAAPFALCYSPRPLYALFAHRQTALPIGAGAQDSRVVPEPGTIGKSRSSLTLPILAKQDCIRADLPFQGLATRNPMLLFSFVGLSLFRFDESKLLKLLFQLPPRNNGQRPLNHRSLWQRHRMNIRKQRLAEGHIQHEAT